MIKRTISALVALTLIISLGTFMTLTVSSQTDNLFTYDFVNLSEGFTVTGNALSFKADTEGFYDFSAAASNLIAPGNDYKVSYTVNVNSSSGAPEVRISDKTDSSQFGAYKEAIYIWAPVHEASYIYTASENADECASMFKSYIHLPQGASLDCTISITITPIVKEYTIFTTVNSQTIKSQKEGDEIFLFLPASADTSTLPLSGSVNLSYNGNSITLSDTETIVNLDEFLGEDVVPGEEYVVEVSASGIPQPSLHILKADNISTIFAVLNKTVPQIHESKEVSAKGDVYMYTADGTQANDKTLLKKFSGRGNTSWIQSGEKRPYNVNFDSKVELIDGAGKAKKWGLISDNCQGGWVHEGAIYSNAAAYDMFQKLGGDYPVSYEFVNVYINGEYRGIYILSERVEIGSARVDITESEYEIEDEENKTLIISTDEMYNTPIQWNMLNTENAIYTNEDPLIQKGIQAYQYATNSSLIGETGGFLLELDRGFHGEVSWFVTRRGVPYVVKEPEFATRDQLHLIASYVQEYEDALFSDTGFNDKGKYYGEYIDIDSMARKLLVDLATGQCDVFVSSCYFATDMANGSLTPLLAGPAWDYDGSDYTSDAVFYGSDNPTKEMITALLKHGDFLTAFTTLSNGEFKTLWDNEKLLVSSYIEKLDSSYKLNSAMWNRDGSNPKSANGEKFLEYFNGRYNLWYNSLFDNSKTLGLTISEKNFVLTANSVGTTGTLSWKKLNSDGTVTDLNHSGNTFAPTETGTYFCTAKSITHESFETNDIISNPIVIDNYSISFEDDTFFFNCFKNVSAMAIVAEYNEFGNLINVTTKPITSSDFIRVTPVNGITYKAFLWDSQKLLPLCNSLTK